MRTVTREIQIAGRSFSICLPASPEDILDDAIQAEQQGVSGHDPYWGLLWDAAHGTAQAILRRQWTESLSVLELGCGVGLAGIAALAAGLQVTFSDLVPDAVQMAIRNAERNGFPHTPGLTIDWRNPPKLKFDLLLASDVLYDVSNHQLLLNVMDVMLAESGQVWIGDAGRYNAAHFIEVAMKSGWQVRLEDENGNPLHAPQRVRFQLLDLRKS